MTTRYSEPVKGEKSNYQWEARFDLTDGHLGINQSQVHGGCGSIQRVLLSPKQVTALKRFLAPRVPRRPR